MIVGLNLIRVVSWLGTYGVCLRVVLFRFADYVLLCFGLWWVVMVLMGGVARFRLVGVVLLARVYDFMIDLLGELRLLCGFAAVWFFCLWLLGIWFWFIWLLWWGCVGGCVALIVVGCWWCWLL